jgi:hypothetical protein
MKLAVLLTCVLTLPLSETAVAVAATAPTQPHRVPDRGAVEELTRLQAEVEGRVAALVPDIANTVKNGPAHIRESRERNLRLQADIAKSLRAIDKQGGWPGERVLGSRGAELALKLAFRVTNDDFQQWCLVQLPAADARGEVPRGYEQASLLDAILTRQGAKQRYGTAFDIDFATSSWKPKPIQDEAGVDVRRAAMGMPSLADEYSAFNTVASLKDDVKRDPASQLQALVGWLDAHGFFRHTRADIPLEGVKQAIAREDFLFQPETGRVFDAGDSHGRAGDAGRLLERVKPFLAREGVSLQEVVEASPAADLHTLRVNGHSFTLWSHAETLSMAPEDLGRLATRRTFKVVNQLLGAARSDERLWLLDDSSGRKAVFLTPAQQAAIRFSPHARAHTPTMPAW